MGVKILILMGLIRMGIKQNYIKPHEWRIYEEDIKIEAMPACGVNEFRIDSSSYIIR